ncbi:VIR protein [Plasmodium vivax]|uniref:VIR protein n=1 Tax=Plasmodium vivax TaxID=5855 RepID=A0A1G4E6J3_PLAVI|nr:VIR protein [Plasmodium vivax]
MASNKEDTLYLAYGIYNDVKYHYDKALNYIYDEEPLNKVISYMLTEKHNMHKDDYIIRKFFNLLRNDHVYVSGLTQHYCKYINLWLNKEYRKEINQNKLPKFDVFRTFVRKLNEVHAGNSNKSCEEYIKPLESETITKSDFLYLLYDLYNKIKDRKTTTTDLEDACSNLAVRTIDYRDWIHDYYVNDKDLYNKLEYIIKEIDKITGIKTTSPCEQKIYFTKPTKLENLLEEKRKEAAELAARLAKAEADRLAKEKEARQTKEEGSRQHPDILSGSSHNGLQEILHENRELPSSSYQTGSQGFVTSRLYSRGERFDSSEWRKSPKESLFAKGYTPPGQIEYTLEGRGQQSGLDQEQGDKGKTIPGTSFSSSGFPGYITEVLGSVEPGPVLGVSGGMGVLFLLFKYTPVGSFFGGRSGRFRQIPRSFGGFQPDFANFQDYDGGYIRYGPMSISSLAE